MDNGLGCVKDADATITGSPAPNPNLTSPGAVFVCLADTAEPGIDLLVDSTVSCALTLEMFDAASNGWDSAEVSVFVDGSPVGPFAVADGDASETVLIPIQACTTSAGRLQLA